MLLIEALKCRHSSTYSLTRSFVHLFIQFILSPPISCPAAVTPAFPSLISSTPFRDSPQLRYSPSVTHCPVPVDAKPHTVERGSHHEP